MVCAENKGRRGSCDVASCLNHIFMNLLTTSSLYEDAHICQTIEIFPTSRDKKLQPLLTFLKTGFHTLKKETSESFCCCSYGQEDFLDMKDLWKSTLQDDQNYFEENCRFPGCKMV